MASCCYCETGTPTDDEPTMLALGGAGQAAEEQAKHGMPWREPTDDDYRRLPIDCS